MEGKYNLPSAFSLKIIATCSFTILLLSELLLRILRIIATCSVTVLLLSDLKN